jgi:hypothetical protein
LSVLSLYPRDGSRDVPRTGCSQACRLTSGSVVIAHIVPSLPVTLILGIVFSALAE